MKISANFWMFVFSSLFVIPVSAVDYDVSGMSNDVDASLQLKSWITDIGFTANNTESRDGVLVEDDYRVAIFPKVNAKGLDRLVIYKTFKGKSSNVGSAELAKLMNEVNNKFNVCSAFVDKDGDLVLRFILTFDDKITPRLFRNTLEHVKGGTVNLISEFKARFALYFD